MCRCLTLVLLSLAAAGCRDAPPDAGGAEAAADSVAVSVTDSADVAIVRIPDLWSLELPGVTTTPIHSTADAGLELGNVVGAVFLPDSSLVVADRGADEIIFLDRAGSVLRRTGRDGDGPGEYRNIARIGVRADGTVFVYDRELRRFTFLDSDGGFIAVQRVPTTSEMLPLVHMQGAFLAVLETRPELPVGVRRGPLFLVRVDESTQVVDTVGRWPGKERTVTPDAWLPIGHGVTALYAGRGSHTVLGTNDSVDVTLYRGSTPVTRIRGGHTVARVTEEEREAWTQLYLSMYPEPARYIGRRRLERSPPRETYPAFGALKVDDRGRTWIGAYAGTLASERRWTVLGGDGNPIGAIDLPVYRPDWVKVRGGSLVGHVLVEAETTIPSLPHELLDVAGGLIAVLRRGEFDEEYIEVHGFRVGSTAPSPPRSSPPPSSPRPAPS